MSYPGVPTKPLRLERSNATRPAPPPSVAEDATDTFAPANELRDWVFSTFVHPDGALYSPTHEHLLFAHLGCLWTNVLNVRQMRGVIGQAEKPTPKGGKWQIARQKLQLREWFGGSEPHFVITLHAPTIVQMSDRAFCALVEHELFHCAQALNEYGAPKFTKEGFPVFALKGHDIEEFHGVIARYGLTEELRTLLEAANQKPELPDRIISGACGTCLLKAVA